MTVDTVHSEDPQAGWGNMGGAGGPGGGGGGGAGGASAAVYCEHTCLDLADAALTNGVGGAGGAAGGPGAGTGQAAGSVLAAHCSVADSCDRTCDSFPRHGIHRSTWGGTYDHLFPPDAAAAACCGYLVEAYDCFYLYDDAPPVPDTTPFFHCTSGPGGDFYTTHSACEFTGLTNAGSIGRIGTVPFCGARWLYRMYHTATGLHFHTVSEVERDALVGAGGWIYEGPAGYVWSGW